MTIEHEPIDLLEELSKGEDEFDVDLMACGCRLAAVTDFEWSIHDFVRLYDLKGDQLVSLVGALVDAGEIDHQTLHNLADKVARGDHQEVDERAQVRVVEDNGRGRG